MPVWRIRQTDNNKEQQNNNNSGQTQGKSRNAREIENKLEY